jgi:phosphatidylserine synthase
MHHRVAAWVLASTIAPTALVVTTVIAALVKSGGDALLVALFWQSLLGFLLLTVSLVMLSPLLFWPLERRQLSQHGKITLISTGVGLAIVFVVCLVTVPLEVSMAVGLLLNAAGYVLIVPRPNNTVERDEDPDPIMCTPRPNARGDFNGGAGRS